MILHPKTVEKCYGLVKGGFNLTMPESVAIHPGLVAWDAGQARNQPAHAGQFISGRGLTFGDHGLDC